MKFTKLFFYVCLVFLTVFYPEKGTASVVDPDYGDIAQEDSETTYEMVCSIRKLFCGTTAIVIVSFVIFGVGMLLFQGKLSWGYVIVIMTGITIFVGANQLTKAMMGVPSNLGVVKACEC